MMFYKCENLISQIEKELYQRMFETGFLEDYDNGRTKKQIDVHMKDLNYLKNVQKIELGNYEYVKKFNYFFQQITYYYSNGLIIHDCFNIYGKGKF